MTTPHFVFCPEQLGKMAKGSKADGCVRAWKGAREGFVLRLGVQQKVNVRTTFATRLPRGRGLDYTST